VVIRGSGFMETASVSFGMTAADRFSVDSDTQISAVSPRATGTVDVIVTAPGGVSAIGRGDLFTYLPGPSVARIDPSTGPPAGGTKVVIYGRGFSGATRVSFGNTAATFSVDSDGQITVVSPPGPRDGGFVDVTVTTGGGTSSISKGDQFLYTNLL